MPMTFDTYNNCAFGCMYCFSQFQRAIGGGKEHYLGKDVLSVNPDHIKRMFSEPDKYGGQFAEYIKQRRFMQWGGAFRPIRRLRTQVRRYVGTTPFL